MAADFDGSILTSIVEITPKGTYETCLLNTVAENRSWFTPRQFSRSKLAIRIYAMMGHPSHKDFHNMVCSHTIKNCPLTIDDITGANTVFGPDLG